MKFSEVEKHVGGMPYINPRNAKILYRFIVENNIKTVLELGIAHGTASCYIAAALEENGGGELVCVDLEEAKSLFKPSAEELLTRTGLGKDVRIVREKTGYNWFLHNEIQERTSNNACTPHYDLCIIDGPKNWTIDGAAFFMADKLLKPGGWIIFDDYLWSYADAAEKGAAATDGIAHRSLSQAELEIPQIKEVFQLLVMQHPGYHNFRIHGEGDWAWAQKADNTQLLKQIDYVYNVTYKDGFSKLFRMITRLLKKRKL